MRSVPQLTATFAAILGSAHAFWRMDCHSRTGLARIDPLVDPGTISDHAHAIHGGSNFGLTTSFEDLMSSECTSCLVTEDKSAYWTPSLHFLYPNGTAVVVPQVGGMLAYYLLYGSNIQAFPAGFRMLSGDTRQRNFTWPVPDPAKSEWSGDQASQKALSQKALGFNCLDYSKNPEGSLYRHFMPDKAYLDANCPDGLRLELMFPSCWNGKDLDSDDHKSHVAFSSLVMDGDCPSGFETRLPSLFYETIWNTYAFKGVEGEFVLANGDPTGYGYHGDFMTGWDVDFLQSAVETCTNPSGLLSDCPLFTLQSQAEGAKCQLESIPSELADEDCAGPSDGLCGNVPIQSGPAYASPLHGGASATYAEPSTSSTSSAAASVTEAPSTSQVVIPTLSYSEGTKFVTDSYGGGITIAAVDTAESTTIETPSPSPTPAATLSDDGLEDNEKILYTTYYTKDGAVYEVVIVEEEITVLADGPAPTVAKRQVARHNHAHHGHW